MLVRLASVLRPAGRPPESWLTSRLLHFSQLGTLSNGAQHTHTYMDFRLASFSIVAGTDPEMLLLLKSLLKIDRFFFRLWFCGFHFEYYMFWRSGNWSKLSGSCPTRLLYARSLFRKESDKQGTVSIQCKGRVGTCGDRELTASRLAQCCCSERCTSYSRSTCL